jgi:hypothetical protein
MRADDFFTEDNEEGPFGLSRARLFKYDLVNSLRASAQPEYDDLEVALGLAELADQELQSYGTSGGETLNDLQITLTLRALKAVLKRLGVDFDPPWRDFTTFRTYWLKKGAKGSYQARRDIVNEFFEPLHATLLAMEDDALESTLAEPISPRTEVGWREVDQEIRELRRRFRSASTSQDYRAIGTHCVGVLEALGMIVYDPSKHLRPGESDPPRDKTKQRLGRFIEGALGGEANEKLRGVATKTIELAHEVKHRSTLTRCDAGIAGDAVILLTNILRRLSEDGQRSSRKSTNSHSGTASEIR